MWKYLEVIKTLLSFDTLTSTKNINSNFYILKHLKSAQIIVSLKYALFCTLKRIKYGQNANKNCVKKVCK